MSNTVQLLRRGAHPDGTPLSKQDREQLVTPFLPKPRASHAPGIVTAKKGLRTKKQQDTTELVAPTQRPRPRRKARRSSLTSLFNLPPIRTLLALLLYRLAFFIIQLFFSVYIHARSTYHGIRSRLLALLYYHHKSPELIRKDVRNLSRLPQHLSVIVELPEDATHNDGTGEGVHKLMQEVGEVAAWSAVIGIPMLSVYERTGALKAHMPAVHRALSHTLKTYYPPNSVPTFSLRAPHLPPYIPDSSSRKRAMWEEDRPHIDVLLLSAHDGRATLVDLTKTLTEMAQAGKIAPADVTEELIDAEVTESSCGEPDLLIVMAPSSTAASTYSGSSRHVVRPRGRRRFHRRTSRVARYADTAVFDDSDVEHEDAHDPELDIDSDEESERVSHKQSGEGGDVCLRGYPPWQVRLAEIFYVRDGMGGVEYQTFLRALYRYAKCQMRFGR
ncbi:MAG: hypothetical protein M1828_005006 [Chrysothrix sp. TS-e1954]|nr:MAG: hypothetical protein M1828_005006 [Chrysothrix sp. TS-e1954]